MQINDSCEFNLIHSSNFFPQMPPKRKATGKAAAGGKKAKKEAAEEAPKTVHDHIASLKAADAGKKKKHKVDDRFPYAASCEVSTRSIYHIHCV